MEDNIETHESYGMVSVGRSTGGNLALFGSKLKHNNIMRLTISEADVKRMLNDDWYHAVREIIEIEMSPLQYSEMITNPNTSGVPCTIRRVKGKRMENPPFERAAEKHKDEYNKDMDNLNNDFKNDMTSIRKILSSGKAPNKGQRESILGLLTRVEQALGSNSDFAKEQFERMVDKTMLEAKSAIEAYHTHRIIELGTKEYKKEISSKINEIEEMK